MIALFWAAVVFTGYVVVGFPIMVMARAMLRPQPFVEADSSLSVSVIVAAHNEQAVISDKVDNVLATLYPGRLELIIVSDGSSDATAKEASRPLDHRVQVLDLPRLGKAGALNAAVARAAGEVLVFTDANSMLEPGSLAALLRPFAEPGVGGVAGNQVYRQSGTDGLGERAHWNLDRRLKVAESRAGNAVSATGALYALRRELFQPIVEGVTDDFYVSTGVIAQGRRLVFAPMAVAVESIAEEPGQEFQRKLRVMTRGFQSVRARRELLNPYRFGFYALQLWTYKVFRRLLVVPLVLTTVTALILAPRGRLYRWLALLQAGFWSLAAVGVMTARRRVGRFPLFAMPGYVLLGMWASVRALFNVAAGRTISRWDNVRAAEEATAA